MPGLCYANSGREGPGMSREVVLSWLRNAAILSRRAPQFGMEGAMPKEQMPWRRMSTYIVWISFEHVHQLGPKKALSLSLFCYFHESRGGCCDSGRVC